MPLTRRSRLAILSAGVAAFALIAAMVLVSQPGPSGPRLDGAAASLPVTAAESAKGPVDIGNGHFVGADQHHDKSPELRTIKAKPVRAIPLDEEEDDEAGARDTKGSTGPASPVQNTLAAPAMPTSTSFDGIPFPGVACNCAPPDTNGEVGATQYVQMVNEGFQVFNKSTHASVYGPAAISTIWSGAGNVCETAGHGDPVVLYDQLAGRWLVSQFAGSSVPTDQCVAISTTSDATGSWYRYDFHLGSNFMDYPHGAVWTDGYYFSFNVFNSAGTSFLGPQPVVFDRARMLLGQAATFQTIAPSGNTTYLPADIDGSATPAAGTPATFVSFPDFGTYNTYHYHVDWATPANSSFTTFASPAAAGFTLLCSTTRSCVPQPGTTAKLDALADRLMFRLAYRKFSDHESVVGTYTVSSGGVAGLRWFELRNVSSGPVTVFQESTYQPDTTWRWMGSTAMDKNGDLAIGFNVSSTSVVPGLRYAGRLASDPLSSLAQGEATLFAGIGSQSGTSSRWGDYADLTVDPVDDCTFWFTGEYYPSGVSQFNWRTRIGSFAFPDCTGTQATPGSITGTVTDASTSAALSGATVSIAGGGSTSTDSAGHYTFSNLAPATYSVTASMSGYTASAPSNVVVTSGNATTQNFALTPSIAPHASSAYATSSVAGAGGDGNGYEGSRANLWGAPDGLFATDANSGTSSSSSCTSTARDKEIVGGYSLTNLGTSILGIQVAVKGKVSSNKNGPKFCVQLSWDGGATWTTGKTTGTLTTTNTVYTLGATSDTWGHAWTAAQLGSTNLRVRIVDLANSSARTFSLDSVQVTVTSQ